MAIRCSRWGEVDYETLLGGYTLFLFGVGQVRGTFDRFDGHRGTVLKAVSFF